LAGAAKTERSSAISFPLAQPSRDERELICKRWSDRNNKTRRQLLGISLKTLHNKLKEYGGSAPKRIGTKSAALRQKLTLV